MPAVARAPGGAGGQELGAAGTQVPDRRSHPSLARSQAAWRSLVSAKQRQCSAARARQPPPGIVSQVCWHSDCSSGSTASRMRGLRTTKRWQRMRYLRSEGRGGVVCVCVGMAAGGAAQSPTTQTAAAAGTVPGCPGLLPGQQHSWPPPPLPRQALDQPTASHQGVQALPQHRGGQDERAQEGGGRGGGELVGQAHKARQLPAHGIVEQEAAGEWGIRGGGDGGRRWRGGELGGAAARRTCRARRQRGRRHVLRCAFRTPQQRAAGPPAAVSAPALPPPASRLTGERTGSPAAWHTGCAQSGPCTAARGPT